MQVNKNGIPINFGKVSKRMKQQKQQKQQQEVHKLDFTEYAEFQGFEQGYEIKIVIPNFEPLVKAVQGDGWKYIKTSKGEIA